MWVTKLLIFPVEIRIFCPKTTKFGPKLAFLVNLGQAMQAYSMPCCGSVGGCGARAVSRKTPIYFIIQERSSTHVGDKENHEFPKIQEEEEEAKARCENHSDFLQRQFSNGATFIAVGEGKLPLSSKDGEQTNLSESAPSQPFG